MQTQENLMAACRNPVARNSGKAKYSISLKGYLVHLSFSTA